MTDDYVLKCPKCASPIALSDALKMKIQADADMEAESKFRKLESELKSRELAIDKSSKEIERARGEIEKTINAKVAVASVEKEAAVKAEIERKYFLEVEDLKSQVEEKEERLKSAQIHEITLRRQAREVEQKQKEMELQQERQADQIRAALEETITSRIAEEYKLKLLDEKKQKDTLVAELEVLRRKAEQGSQQLQGEVLEAEFESILRKAFPDDDITPVPTGTRGADIVQSVRVGGQMVGSVLWEIKRTKAFKHSWIEKIKADRRDTKADAAIIMTQVMPKGCTDVVNIEGIWVVDQKFAIGICEVLRGAIAQLSANRRAAVGRKEKMDVIFDYLSGPEFRHRVEAIVEAFSAMRVELDKEKRATHRLWSAREKQIEQVLINTAGMYGDIQGMVGVKLSSIPALEHHEENLEIDSLTS